MLRKLGEVFVAEIGTVTKRDETAVGQEMSAEVAGFVRLEKVELGFRENAESAFLDDGIDVLLRFLAQEAIFGGESVEMRIIEALREVSLADFVEIEGDFVVPDVPGEGDPITVGNFPADTWFADGDGAVTGHQLEELVAADDLEFMQS